MNENVMNILDAQKAKEYIKNSKRVDSRNFNDLRNLDIKVGTIPSADGSAHIKLGNTEIIIGITFSVGTPYSDSPDEGSMVFNLELSGISGLDYRTGPPSIDSVEFGRVADRAIRSAECVDFKKLGLVSGEKSFIVFIDCNVLNADGNLIDAAEYGALAALLNAKIPKLDENYNIISGEYTNDKIPLDVSKLPLSFTFSKIEDKIVLDANFAEEYASNARFSIGLVGDNIVSYHKGKEGVFEFSEIKDMMKIAVSKYDELKNKICDLE